MSNALEKSGLAIDQTPAGKKPPTQQIRKDKALHESVSETEIDKTLKDSFPASDPPAY